MSSRNLSLLASVQLLILAIWLVGIIPVGSSSEAREGQVVYSILHGDNWFAPLRYGLVPSKPPFHHWLTSLLSQFLSLQGLSLQGLSLQGELSLRICSVLAATALLFITMQTSAKLVLSSRLNSIPVLASLLAGAFLSTCYGYFRMLADGRVDMTFSFLVVAAFFSILCSPLVRAYLNKEEVSTAIDLKVFYLCCAFACLTKGPLGLLLPLIMVFLSLSYLIGLKRCLVIFLKPSWGWVLFLGLTLPYYVYSASILGVAGETFLSRQLLFENIERFFGGEKITTRPVYYYIPALLRGLLPWSIIVPAILIFLKPWKQKDCRDDIDRIYRLIKAITVAVVGIIIFFSLSVGKRGAYLLPLYPLIAVCFTLTVCALAHRTTSQTLVKLISLLCKSSLLVLLLALMCLELSHFSFGFESASASFALEWLREKRLQLEVPLLLALLFSLVCLFVKNSDVESKRLYQGCAAWLGLAVTAYVLCFGALGIKNSLKNFKSVADLVNDKVSPADNIFLLSSKREEFFDPILYYLERDVQLLVQDETSSLPQGSFILGKTNVLNVYQAQGFLVVSRFASLASDPQKRLERELALVYTP